MIRGWNPKENEEDMKTATKEPYVHVVKNTFNKKLNPTGKGRIWSLSFPPLTTCIDKPPCESLCYSLKAMQRYPVARNAWMDNLIMYRRDPVEFWKQVQDAFDRATPKTYPELFRLQSAGDFIRPEMVQEEIELAKANPDVLFMAFTKRYSWLPDVKTLPSNLVLIMSMWKNLPVIGPHVDGYGRAWMLDPKDPDERIPSKTFKCDWNCVACKFCFTPGAPADILFHKHTNGRRKKDVSQHHHHKGVNKNNTGFIKKPEKVKHESESIT